MLEQRTLNGFTPCRVANHLGIAQPSYSRYENGSAEPSIDTPIKLANLFDVSIDYLTGREDYKKGVSDISLTPFLFYLSQSLGIVIFYGAVYNLADAQRIVPVAHDAPPVV